jgi:hypothetical protein
MTDAEIRELNRTVHRTRAGLDELAIRLAAAAEDRGLAREDGCTSTTAWLAQLAGIPSTMHDDGKTIQVGASGACRPGWIPLSRELSTSAP